MGNNLSYNQIKRPSVLFSSLTGELAAAITMQYTVDSALRKTNKKTKHFSAP